MERVLFECKAKAFAKSPQTLFSVIPAKVPRRARDPELTEGAGIQEYPGPLDLGLCRGDDLEPFANRSRLTDYYTQFNQKMSKLWQWKR